MTDVPLEQLQIRCDETLRSVMDRFTTTAAKTGGVGFLVVIDSERRCVGVITDGDVRRALLAGETLEAKASSAMTSDFVSTEEGRSRHQLLRLCNGKIRHLPVISSERRLQGVVYAADIASTMESKERVVRARAPVRVSFAGGGTDMSFYFGSNSGLVLSATINKYCYASVSVRDDSQITISSREFEEHIDVEGVEDLKYDGTLDLPKACIKLMRPEFGVDLSTYSEIEPGTGLGGSAAVSCAVIGALNHFRNQDQLSRYDIADLAYQAERVELGIEGGWQDQYSSSFGGMNLIEFRHDSVVVNPLRIPDDILLELHLNLLLFRFGGRRESGAIVAEQASLFNDAEGRRALYDEMRALALSMKDHLVRGELTSFGKSLDVAWTIKKRFAGGISNSTTDRLYATARSAGAIGGKLLGAGGSGYLLIYCDPEFQANVVRHMQALGATWETFDFVENGVQMWTADKRPYQVMETDR